LTGLSQHFVDLSTYIKGQARDKQQQQQQVHKVANSWLKSYQKLKVA